MNAPQHDRAAANDWTPAAAARKQATTPTRGWADVSRHSYSTVSAGATLSINKTQTPVNSDVQAALDRISLAVQRALVRIAENEARAAAGQNGGAA